MIDVALQAAAGMAVVYHAAHEVNLHTAEIGWARRLLAALVGTVGGLVLLQALVSFIPVVTSMRLEIVSRTESRVRVSVSGEKSRGSCERLGVDAYQVGRHGLEKVAIEYPDDPSPHASRPGGYQTFSDWDVLLRESSLPTQLLFKAHHDCGFLLGLTHTEFGPYPIPRRGRQ